jgi:hypothetical protein
MVLRLLVSGLFPLIERLSGQTEMTLRYEPVAA